jgi:hypothetical protein
MVDRRRGAGRALVALALVGAAGLIGAAAGYGSPLAPAGAGLALLAVLGSAPALARWRARGS